MTKKTVVLSLLGIFLAVPLALQAASLSGVNMDEVRTKIYTEQGDEWFRALTMEADEDGVIEAEGVIPGWYRFEVNATDAEDMQYVAVKLRMHDFDGKELKKETDVDLYKRVNGEKTSVATVATDDKGWLEVSGIEVGEEYKMEIEEKDGGSLSGKEGRARVKCKAQIQKGKTVQMTDWFQPFYERTDNAYTLDVDNVIPGYYKFSYKRYDRSPELPFNLRLTLRDNKAEEIEEPTPILLSAYIDGNRVPMGQLMTDDDGEVFIPGVMTEMKYKLEVLE